MKAKQRKRPSNVFELSLAHCSKPKRGTGREVPNPAPFNHCVFSLLSSHFTRTLKESVRTEATGRNGCPPFLGKVCGNSRYSRDSLRNLLMRLLVCLVLKSR